MRGGVAIVMFGVACLTTGACGAAAPPMKTLTFVNGAELQQACTTNTAACAAYVMGVADETSNLSANLRLKPLYCSPDGVLGNQLAQVVTTFLNQHPQLWQYSAAFVVDSALISNFPCGAGNGQ